MILKTEGLHFARSLCFYLTENASVDAVIRKFVYELHERHEVTIFYTQNPGISRGKSQFLEEERWKKDVI